MSTHTDAEGVNHRARAGEAYRLWWQHDANWYQGVAARFGQEVANEINAEAMGKVALHVGQRVARLHGPLPDTGDGRKDLEELRRRYDDCGDRMFPPELRNASTEVEDDDLIVLTLRRNFAITMVRMAGSLEGYRCPCTAVHAGWSEGLGVTLTENRAETCLRDGDKACRLLIRAAPAAAPAAVVPGSEG
ncbi:MULTISPECIES: hypothetical protein [Streptomyces]|uniref:Uncharacterized protein n=1 Tax=Streptomyces caniscabiei TaxID=2746961 RepID=A0ABU4MEK3_9ACTN|nr:MULTISPECIES: hypothetical protein [Streptomyces]MBE4736143.1 hypothetical protein [Streptomyces caniscabiei]MBE4755729.1 hypothetical protein [Streptomyces caniscabiei]MBE4771683.1 hypothetical protein [Streptomyces caniscabiei]MBE4785890.1 hypothetical protein [Streptomyces caniscabiei]MBE4793911.1 hypothetical protein [Streptomyces caniscabiei]